MVIRRPHPLRAIAPPTILSEPVMHPDHEAIEREVVDYLVKTWEWPSERHMKGFVSWKLAEVVLFMFPTGNTTRVKLACELLLLGFLIDVWFDHQTMEQNAAVVSRLAALLDSPSTATPLTTIERMHARIFSRILSVDDEGSRVVLDTYMDMLALHGDASRGGVASLHMREYLTFREVDVGMTICMALLYWTEEIALAPGQAAQLEPLEHVANYHVSVLNDVFSFDRKWAAAQTLGEGAALVNGVRIMADETAVSVATAKALCFGLVRAWEAEFRRMADDVLARDGMRGDEKVARMIRGIERRMTGAEAFSWRTKRYL